MTALLAYIDTGAAIGLLWQRVTRRLASLRPSRATLHDIGEFAAMLFGIALFFAVATAIGAVAGIAMGN